VTLSWDESHDRTVKGYRLRYGVSSGRKYFHVLDVGKATSCKLPDLIPGKKYYFVVTAYNASGRDSLPSNEVTFTAPKSTPTPRP
jgi:chitinase